MRLPEIPYDSAPTAQAQTAFAGIDYRYGAGNGAIVETVNCSTRRYPALCSAPARRGTDAGVMAWPNGLYVSGESPNASGYAGGHHYTVNGNALRRNGDDATAKTLTTDISKQTTERTMLRMGERLIVWPDKVSIDLTDWDNAAVEPLAKAVGGNGLAFANGEIHGEAAEANSLVLPAAVWEDGAFAVGDAVTIHGTPFELWDKTIIIREIDAASRTLRFDEHSFDPPQGTTLPVTVETYVSVARRVPDLDYLCEQGNRLWGCKGDTIWCSKLGDPRNWYVYDGLSTDSWTVDTGSGGSFTACCSFLGYPCFFKSDRIYKVYGTRPENFELVGGPTLGVRPGCAKSLAVVGDMLYYVSRRGLTVYAGGLPRPATELFGDKRLSDAVAGTDGRYYYLAARERLSGVWSEWVYDTETGLLCREEAVLWRDEWPGPSDPDYHKADDRRLVGYGAYNSGIMRLHRNGETSYCGEDMRGEGVEPSYCVVEFGDWDYVRSSSRSGATFAAAYPVRLWVRTEAPEDVALGFFLRYDGGEWEQAAAILPGSKRDDYLALPVRRCRRYALKIEATGPFTLLAIERELVAEAKARR